MLFKLPVPEDQQEKGIVCALAEDGEIFGRIVQTSHNVYQLEGYQRITPVGTLMQQDWVKIKDFPTEEEAFVYAQELGTKLWNP